MPPFSNRLIAWQRQHGRHDLPWQGTRDPYRIWLSEIMLQQTQVATVPPYYQRFLARFPDVAALAEAPLDAILAAWAGLGYYARARNLHRCARQVMERHGGAFPSRAAELAELAGVGRSTAAAIAVFSAGERAAILDGNVKRVLCRHQAIAGFPGTKAIENQLWQLAENLLPESDIEAYTQGLMDLGATLCTRSRPDCAACPLAVDCLARLQGRQAELPSPRRRAERPWREVDCVVLLAGKRVLLERRPPVGIWGGLLALPEGKADEVCIRFGLPPATATPLPEVDHDFTHFRLRLRPWLCPLAAALPWAAGEADHRWLDLDEIEAAALPAPVLRLLQSLRPVANAAG